MNGKRTELASVSVFVAALALAGLAGCAGTPLKTEGSLSAIRAAEEVGAADVPRAALYLQLAKEHLERARALSQQGEREQAVSLLRRSEADAELAVALAHGETERKEAEAAMLRVQELRQDNR